MSFYPKFFKSGSYLFLGQILVSFLLFLTNLIVIRVLTKEDYGSWVLLGSLSLFAAAFSSFAIPAVSAKKLSDYKAESLSSEMNHVIVTYFLLGIFLTAVVCLSVYLFRYQIAGWVGIEDLARHFDLLSIWIACYSGRFIMMGILTGLRRLKLAAFLLGVFELVLLVSVAVSLSMGANLRTLVIGYSIGAVIGLGICGFVFLKEKLIWLTRVPLKTLFEIVGSSLKYCVLFFPSYFLPRVLPGVLLLLLGRATNREEVAYFGIAFSFSGIARLVMNPFIEVLLPFVSETYTQQSKELAHRMTTVFKVASLFSLLTLTAYVCFGRFAIGVIYGDRYLAVEPLSLVLALVCVIEILSSVVDTFLRGTVLEKVSAKTELGKFFALLFLIVIFFAWLDKFTLALLMLFVTTVTLGVRLLCLKKYFDIKVTPQPFLWLLILGGLALAHSLGLSSIFLIVLFFTFLPVLFFQLSKEERFEIIQAFRRKLGPERG